MRIRDLILPLVRDYVVNIWEVWKIKLYGDDSSQSQSSTGDLGEFPGIEAQSGKNMCQGGKPDTGKFHSSYIRMNVCGSAYENGCMVDGTCATPVFLLILGAHAQRVLFMLIASLVTLFTCCISLAG